MEKSERIWNRRFILLFITNLLVLAAFYASIPIIPLYCEEIGITGSKVGIVLTAMSVATILFRPVAGYLLDNFNRYRVYLIFLALFCLSFPAFLAFPVFGALIVVRLYMGAVYLVCGSATMTLAGDVLPAAKVTQGISRFAFTVSIGMALGPFVGLQVQENLSSRASFLTIFGIAVAALICVSLCRIKYPKVQRGRFSLKESIYAPALPFMLNMMFLMIPYGAVIAYSSILAQEKGLTPWLPYFYVFLVAGMLASKLSTQKHIDAGNHLALVSPACWCSSSPWPAICSSPPAFTCWRRASSSAWATAFCSPCSRPSSPAPRRRPSGAWPTPPTCSPTTWASALARC